MGKGDGGGREKISSPIVGEGDSAGSENGWFSSWDNSGSGGLKSTSSEMDAGGDGVERENGSTPRVGEGESGGSENELISSSDTSKSGGIDNASGRRVGGSDARQLHGCASNSGANANGCSGGMEK